MRRRQFLRAAAVGGGSATLLASGGVTAQEPYQPLGDVAIENAKEAVVGDDGKTVFVAATNGFATVDISNPANPTVLAERRDLLANRDDGPMTQIWDVKQDGDRLLVAGPANPVSGEVVHGFLLYDVSDPSKPKRMAFHETEYPIHNAMFVDGIAYLTGNDGEGNPLVMVDTSNDKPKEVGRWSITQYDSAWSEVDSWVRSLHDVWVQDGTAYLAMWDAGTWLVDVSNPKQPSHVAHFGGQPLDKLASIPDDGEQDAVLGLPGNDHYVRANEDGSLVVVNKEAWDTDSAGGNGPGGMELWDLSNPDNPKRLSEIYAPQSADPTYDLQLPSLLPIGVASAHGKCHDCTGGGGTDGQWTTSHNFDIVGDRLYTSWYQGGVKLFDISDPTKPKELAWWRKPQKTAFWTSQHVSDDFFVASSMGRHDDGKGGLYTFPNRAGKQANPPKLTPGGNGTQGAISAPKDESTTTSKQPGFGFGVAGLSVLGVGILNRLRKRD
ncbi:LVIVD repeat-containing protein [Haladaptatus sp. DFWS20]|uniref:LVIVD repeat-containing protein n=1 Tax=Haladaptatus sp. DFWS20 TaxID=3403467 RepID=UPI003EB7C9AF